ncbi:hypothetical protein KC315_g15759, partial [Hortaea werneckii]
MNHDTSVDPLLEQMSGLLRLTHRPSTSSKVRQRPRRFSDADQLPSNLEPETLAVRSRDGSRWLPKPAEQTEIHGSRNRAGSSLLASGTKQDVDFNNSSDPNETPNPHNCLSATCSLREVFRTTELLELILSFIETKDILAQRLTSKQWASTIIASPQLKLHFFYYPQFTRPADEFILLPLSLPGLLIQQGEPLHLGRWIHISMTEAAAKAICPFDSTPKKRLRSRSFFEGLRGGLGARAGSSNDQWPKTDEHAVDSSTGTEGVSALQYKDLFVAQPPVVGMQAFIYTNFTSATENDSDTDDSTKHPCACAKLSCDAGITLGFLAETAQSLLRSRQAEPASSAAAKDVRVVFKAIVSFTKGKRRICEKRMYRDEDTRTPFSGSNQEGEVSSEATTLRPNSTSSTRERSLDKGVEYDENFEMDFPRKGEYSPKSEMLNEERYGASESEDDEEQDRERISYEHDHLLATNSHQRERDGLPDPGGPSTSFSKTTHGRTKKPESRSVPSPSPTPSQKPQTKPVPVSWSSLPKKSQLAILTLARLSEPLTQTSLQAYMYYQLKSFRTAHENQPPSDAVVAQQAGLLAAAFTGAQFCTAILWGRLADSEH